MATILVVEDNRDNMDLIEEILEDEGHEVRRAPQAEDGLKMLGNGAVDLIVMDLSLPRMSGLEATRRIKANPDTRDIPLVVITAHARTEDRDSAVSAGCDDFLTKPIDEDILIDTINRLTSV